MTVIVNLSLRLYPDFLIDEAIGFLTQVLSLDSFPAALG